MKRSRELRWLALCLANVIVLNFLFPTNAGPQNPGAEVKAPKVAWDRTFGGSDYESASSVQQTSDGGYILVGSIDSFGADGTADGKDIWLIKTDDEGKKQWDRIFGGAGQYATSVQQTSDGGYILAGSIDFCFLIAKRYISRIPDIWLIKTDDEGKKQWDCTFGDSSRENIESANSVQQTSDNGYIIAGSKNLKAWLIKTDAEGKKQWDCTFGGSDYESANSVQQTSDGGYILAGWTASWDTDAWLIKTDAEGKKQWDRTFGDLGYESAYSVQQTSDGGYILAGGTDSFGAGGTDAWLIKTDAEGKKQWDRTFGDLGFDYANSVQQTSDNGYILAGSASSFGAGEGDVWLIKTDAEGKKQWDCTFGGSGYDYANSVQQTSDGGYILAGSTSSFGAGRTDVWLIKLEGEIPTAVEDQDKESGAPEAFVLFQNYPNPFNPWTEIAFSLPENTYVTLTVFNSLGQKIEILVDGKRGAGKYLAIWDGTGFPSGVYFYRLETESFNKTMKMLLMK